MDKILSLQFIDNLGKDFILEVESPKEGLTQGQIDKFMKFVVDSNLMVPNNSEGDSYLVSALRAFYN